MPYRKCVDGLANRIKEITMKGIYLALYSGAQAAKTVNDYGIAKFASVFISSEFPGKEKRMK